MKNIKTGIDRLLELISTKKRIELEDAAKQIGVGKEVLQEWAELLEQEGIVTLKPSFSKVWIEEKEITKEDVLLSAKELSSEKDAFVRRVDVALNSLEKETTGFEEIRKHFIEIQSHIKKEIDAVKNEVEELKTYNSLKTNLDLDIEKQKKTFQALIDTTSNSLKNEEEKISNLHNQIETEKKTIEASNQKIIELKKTKEDVEKLVLSSRESLKKAETLLSQYYVGLSSSEKRLNDLKKLAEKTSNELESKKSKLTGDATKQIQSHSEKIVAAQNELLKKVKERTDKMADYTETTRKIYDGFKGFFLKNIETEKLISPIEADKNALQKDLVLLRAKAEAFSYITQNKKIKEQISDIELGLKSVEKRKENLKSNTEKLIDLIKGAAK